MLPFRFSALILNDTAFTVIVSAYAVVEEEGHPGLVKLELFRPPSRRWNSCSQHVQHLQCPDIPLRPAPLFDLVSVSLCRVFSTGGDGLLCPEHRKRPDAATAAMTRDAELGAAAARRHHLGPASRRPKTVYLFDTGCWGYRVNSVGPFGAGKYGPCKYTQSSLRVVRAEGLEMIGARYAATSRRRRGQAARMPSDGPTPDRAASDRCGWQEALSGGLHSMAGTRAGLQWSPETVRTGCKRIVSAARSASRKARPGVP